MIGVMVGLGLFCLEITLLWEMDGPSLVCWAQKVSLVIYFIGISLSISWFFLLPLFFPLSILGLFAGQFPTLALALFFSFSFAF